MSLEFWAVVVSLLAAFTSWHFSRSSQKAADLANHLNNLIFKAEQAERIRKLSLTAALGDISKFRKKLSSFIPILKQQGYSRSDIHKFLILPTHVEMNTAVIDQETTDAYLADVIYGSATPDNMSKLKNSWPL